MYISITIAYLHFGHIFLKDLMLPKEIAKNKHEIIRKDNLHVLTGEQ